MARAKKRTAAEERLERNRYNLWQGQRKIERSPLSALLEKAEIEECGLEPGNPETACVDPAEGIVRVNTRGRVLSEDDWSQHLAHMLLHLGLNHAARREDRDANIWSLACEEGVYNLLPLFGFPDRLSQETGEREEAAYNRIIAEAEERKLKRLKPAVPVLQTPAGRGRPDIVGIGRVHRWRKDYEQRLGEGIRRALEEAIREASQELADGPISAGWPPAERARRWVMNELPLLGALAAQIRVIADAKLCDRYDIGIAAVSGWLHEMYFNPDRRLSDGEVLFIYVHELLHVALLHHSRVQGRDPEIWNFATDFVINGWLVEMGVGQLPHVGALYDPRLQGMPAEAVYDLLVQDPRR